MFRLASLEQNRYAMKQAQSPCCPTLIQLLSSSKDCTTGISGPPSPAWTKELLSTDAVSPGRAG